MELNKKGAKALGFSLFPLALLSIVGLTYYETFDRVLALLPTNLVISSCITVWGVSLSLASYIGYRYAADQCISTRQVVTLSVLLFFSLWIVFLRLPDKSFDYFVVYGLGTIALAGCVFTLIGLKNQDTY